VVRRGLVALRKAKRQTQNRTSKMLEPDPIAEHIDTMQRLQMMCLDRRASRSVVIPHLVRYSASIPVPITHWDRLSGIRAAARERERRDL
jgi:isopentenyl diphosphate isomerase/L-lactate dehydrogenase-like FMN-dependent dehydrogenase